MKLKFNLLVLFLLLSFALFSQDSLHFFSSTKGAACYSIKKYGNYIIAGTGSTLRVYDASGSVPYSCVWEYKYKSLVADLLIKNNYLYVAANYDGLTKWDITNPLNPVKVYEYGKATTSAQNPVIDVCMENDTLFLVRMKNMTAVKDLGSSCSFINDFANSSVIGFGRILGADVKNGIVAFAVSDWFGQNGVFLFKTNTLTQLGFYHQTFCYPEGVIWGKNNNILHVLGGSNSVLGYFYSLNVSTPSTPQMIYSDTIPGIALLAIADGMRAQNVNDTIYLVTQAGLKSATTGPLDTTFIHVYDATNTGNIHLINRLPAGLWHFDITVENKKYYIASEWYGILSVDMANYYNPVILGKTLTGGWNLSADKSGNSLVVGNEGYGFKLYNISDYNNPILSKVNYSPGFCSRVRFSENGNYIFATYMSYQGLRVFQNGSLNPVDSISQHLGVANLQVWHNKLYSYNDKQSILNIVDITDPINVSLLTSKTIQINDMYTSTGKLFTSCNDSICVYDISSGNFQKIAYVVLVGNQNGKAMAVYGNCVYAFITNKGLVKYELQYNNPNYSLVEQNTYTLTNGEPTFMAADSFGIYISYRTKGLFLFDRNNLVQKGYYRGELDFKGYDNQWGVQELKCKEGLVLLTEYFTQTTLLTGNDDITASIKENNLNKENDLMVYPNPFNDFTTIKFSNPNNEEVVFELYNIQGQMVKTIKSKGVDEILVDRVNRQSGIYLFKICISSQNIYTGKIVVE